MSNCCHCDDSTTTTIDPPVRGRCCYSRPNIDWNTFHCQDNMLEADCLSEPNSDWIANATCASDPCPDNPPSCFTGDSTVLMEDGTHKKISNVSAGERVKSIDGKVNTVIDIETIHLGTRKLASINGSSLFFSYDHPIITDEGIKSLNLELSRKLYPEIDFVDNLKLGDTIYTKDGEKKVETLTLEHSDPQTKLYELFLDGNHIYFVNGIAFHNHSYASICCYNADGLYLGQIADIGCCNMSSDCSRTPASEWPKTPPSVLYSRISRQRLSR